LAQAHGVALRAATSVVSVTHRGGRTVIATDQGDMEARVVVLTVGPWAGGLVSDALGRPVPVTPTLQAVAHFAPADPGAVAAWATSSLARASAGTGSNSRR